jgi:hypothetical protein
MLADLFHKIVYKNLAIDFKESNLLGLEEFEFIQQGLTEDISIN